MPKVETIEQVGPYLEFRFVAADFDSEHPFFVVDDPVEIGALRDLHARNRHDFSVSMRTATRSCDKSWYRGLVSDLDEIMWTEERCVLIQIATPPAPATNPRASWPAGQRRLQTARRKRATRRR